MQILEAIGWNSFFGEQLGELPPERNEAGADAARRAVPMRVIIEYQDRFQLLGEAGPAVAQLSGNMRHAAMQDRLLRPAVGDWVVVRPGEGDAMGTIVHLLDRRTVFVRQAAGRRVSAQVVAANVDTVFIVTSCNRDFNARRLERYLATVAESGARAVIVLNKADLCADPRLYLDELAEVAPGTPVAVVSAREQRGMDELARHIAPGQTVALVGSSGVGKSTLVNWLIGRDVQTVRDIREDDDRGRHTTTHRELIPLPGGGVLVDTPGMRELQLWSTAAGGLGGAFGDIEALAAQCRFRDCAHAGEPGCAIQQAVRDGTVTPQRYASYLKLAREQAALEARKSASGGELPGRARGAIVARSRVSRARPGRPPRKA